MFLIVISYSYGEEVDSTTTPDIHFELPNFYSVNTSGVVAKNIGVMGWGYTAIFRVTNIDKIKNPENASIKFRILYDELIPINGTFLFTMEIIKTKENSMTQFPYLNVNKGVTVLIYHSQERGHI